MPVRKVNKGDALQIAAKDWNLIADKVNNLGGQATGRSARLGPDQVWVKNTLGRDLSRYSAVLIDDPTSATLMDGTNDPIFTLRNGALTAQVADYSGGNERIVGILQEPIANNRFGRAQISGVTPASFRYDETGGTKAADFACMSDLDDKLTFCQSGPIRVLQRGFTVNSGTASKFWMVQLGNVSNLASAVWESSGISLFTWAATAATDYGNIWTVKSGDAMRVGLYQVGTTTQLNLSRPGRYHVTVEFFISLGSISSGDRAEMKIAHGGGYVDYVTVPASFGAPGVPIIRQLASLIVVDGAGAAVAIPYPGVSANKVTSGGTVSALTVTGQLKVRVIRLGSYDFNTVWSETKRNAAWARTSGQGPI